MLRRNDLISDADAARLEEWIWTTSYALTMIMDGAIAEAFDEYDRDCRQG